MFTIREVSLISAFAALYLAYGYVSGVTLGSLIFSLDLLFLIAALFTILALIVRQPWSATLLGTITGLVFLGTPGAPFPLHITASLIANGLVFDAYLQLMNRRTIPPSKRQIVTAAVLGNLVMATVGLSALQAVGTVLPEYLWGVLVATSGLVGALGAVLGLAVVRRILVPVRSKRSLGVEVSPVYSD